MFVSIRTIWMCCFALGMATLVAANEAKIDLSPNVPVGDVVQVTIELEGGGNNLVRSEEADKETAGAEKKLPMSVSAKLKYDERLLSPVAGTQPAEGTLLAIRHYHQAEAVIKVDESGLTPKLADNRRLILLKQAAERPILYSPDGTLPREQLDLVDVVSNSYLVNMLLPTGPVAAGDTWANDGPLMAGLLTLDSVAACEVQSVLDESNASFAKIRIAGVVNGTTDGAATQQEVRGVYLFDRRLKRITRINLAVKERRSIGGATPGLDAVAKLQMKIEPIKSSPQLTDEIVASHTRSDRQAQLNLLYDSPKLGFRVEHDRQWFITSQQREAVTLRRVDCGDMVAQCTLSALPPKSAGRQTSLEQFQKDITYSLGKNFGELVSSRQWTNSHGNHCYTVVVRGMADEIPVEWHYYLVSPDNGHRLSLAFTIEGQLVERVGQSDQALVEAIELYTPTPPTAETAAAPAETATK